ncbi:MAG TPA: aminodeoxychorismate synthase, component I [Rhodospirillaceae bacterium]|nr:aminodeoxychorismate synthase, component I [Rhodospirillaceae bacterium]
MKQFAFPIGSTSVDAASAFYAERDMIWLDSHKLHHPQSRYSYIVFNPSAPIDLPQPTHDDLPPFQGGYAGFKTYEGDDHFKFYKQLLSFDHHTGQGWFITYADSEAAAHRLYNDICTQIRMAKPVPEFTPHQLDWTSNFTPAEYKISVADIIARIRNGDIFQANLTQRFTSLKPQNFNAFSHYLCLRDMNPAPFSAYMNWGDTHILSTSPESFLSLGKDGRIVTRPIKGTHRDADQLLSSEKDKAENTMIVDLLRNDLSQICTDESVMVDKLCALQSFAGLHHLVSEVSGQLKSGITPMDALNACFPGGSITGAPKIEAIKILEDIEAMPRDIYCGSIGWIGTDGAMDMNIAIRTLIVSDDTLSFGVGGGITALSDPDAEYQETLLKADKILKSFEASRK